MRKTALVAALLCLLAATANGQNIAFGASATSIADSGHAGWFIDGDIRAWRGLGLAVMSSSVAAFDSNRVYVGAGPRYRYGIGRVEVFGHAGFGLFRFDNLWMGSASETVFRQVYGAGVDLRLVHRIGIRAAVERRARAHSRLSDVVSVTPTNAVHVGTVWELGR